MGALSDKGFDEERLTEIARTHDESFQWFHENLEELREKYAGNFIAVYHKNVIAKNPDKAKLFRTLRKNYSKKEIEEIFIDYINPKGYFLII